MLAEIIDAGLLCTATERKNDERILVQIWRKDCVALEVRYHKVCYHSPLQRLYWFKIVLVGLLV